jgi:hypothetical protein
MFARDSPLEGDGFELSVPGRETLKPSWETGLLSKRERICGSVGEPKVRIISLQRRVTCEPDFLDQIRKFVNVAGPSCSTGV